MTENLRSLPMTAQVPTPTPWAADPDWREGYSWNIHIVDAANPHMRICFMTSDGPAQANADLIVEAVNSYASLKARIQVLEDLSRFLCDRLEEFDPGDDEPEREYHGHVAPAVARLRAALQPQDKANG